MGLVGLVGRVGRVGRGLLGELVSDLLAEGFFYGIEVFVGGVGAFEVLLGEVAEDEVEAECLFDIHRAWGFRG